MKKVGADYYEIQIFMYKNHISNFPEWSRTYVTLVDPREYFHLTVDYQNNLRFKKNSQNWSYNFNITCT